MAYANDFRSEPPHRLLHRPRTTMPAHAPAHSTPAGRGGGSAGQQRANARGGGQQALTHANCQYVEFGVLDWPFVFVITTPTLNQDGTVNYGMWCGVARWLGGCFVLLCVCCCE